MKTHIALRTTVIAFAIMFLAAAASDAWSACGSSQRMSYRDSHCLEASWDNNRWPRKSWYQVRNVCHNWGKVVAKVDIRSAGDATLHLTNNSPRRHDGWFQIRSIYCCTDISDLCNHSDMLSNASCREGFNDNNQLNDCTLDSGSDGAKVQGQLCVYSAECLDDASESNETTVTVHRTSVDNLRNCNGVLKQGSC